MIVNKIKLQIIALDKTLLGMILLLSIMGCILVFSSSSVIAAKLHLPSLFFFKKHVFNVSIGFLGLIVITFMPESTLRKFCLLGSILFTILLIMTNVIGTEIKGSTRWITILGFNMQPSEFLKPFYIVVIARILSLHNKHKSTNTIIKEKRFPSYQIVIAIHALITVLLLRQPDLGMSVTYTVIFISLIFVSGISIYWLPITAAMLSFLLLGAYKYLPHVTRRVDSFLHRDIGASYQVEKSIESYWGGGLFGEGPLSGSVKHYLPDCHTDFIFAVAGEELGAIFAAMIIVLIFMISIRALMHAVKINDPFKSYVVAGIAVLYAFQSIFNVGVTLNLLPTKGMTLPFISYGGSSTLSFMIAFGILLNFARINPATLRYKAPFTS